ncbi:MAG: hypothetical protein AAGF60_04980 [Pseudomonadota bacterium]
MWLDPLAAVLSGVYGLILLSVALPFLWYALWVTQDYRRRRAYAAHIATWPDAVLPAARDHYVSLVRAYRAAPFPKPSYRNARDALVMATVLQERIDLAEGRPPATFLASRRRILREAV